MIISQTKKSVISRVDIFGTRITILRVPDGDAAEPQNTKAHLDTVLTKPVVPPGHPLHTTLTHMTSFPNPRSQNPDGPLRTLDSTTTFHVFLTRTFRSFVHRQRHLKYTLSTCAHIICFILLHVQPPKRAAEPPTPRGSGAAPPLQVHTLTDRPLAARGGRRACPVVCRGATTGKLLPRRGVTRP